MWTKSHNNQRAHNERNLANSGQQKKNIRSQRTLTALAKTVEFTTTKKKARNDYMMKQHKNNIMVLGIMRISNKKPIAKCASLH